MRVIISQKALVSCFQNTLEEMSWTESNKTLTGRNLLCDWHNIGAIKGWEDVNEEMQRWSLPIDFVAYGSYSYTFTGHCSILWGDLKFGYVPGGLHVSTPDHSIVHFKGFLSCSWFDDRSYLEFYLRQEQWIMWSVGKSNIYNLQNITSLLFLEKNTIHGERMSTIVLPHEFLYSVMRQTLHCRDSSIDLWFPHFLVSLDFGIFRLETCLYADPATHFQLQQQPQLEGCRHLMIRVTSMSQVLFTLAGTVVSPLGNPLPCVRVVDLQALQNQKSPMRVGLLCFSKVDADDIS